MMAAEQWYEFQEQYQKYGLDMEPARSPERRRRRKSGPTLKIGPGFLFGKEKKIILFMVLVVTIAMIMFIVTTAIASSIRYEISVTQAENAALWDEIKHMQSSQTTMNGVGYVEERADDELGMKVAGNERCVYLTREDIPPAGFADVLKSKTYN